MNSREVAIEVINLVIYKKAYSNITLNTYLNKYDFKREDKALITEIVYGTLKYKGLIDEILNYFLREGVGSIDSYVLTILRTSIYQFKYLDKIPDFAIVNEAVNICKKHRGVKESKLVNGVLRNYMRKGEPRLKANGSIDGKLALQYSFPKWMINLFIEQYGEKQAIEILKGLNERPALTVRVNALKGDYEDTLEKLFQEGYDVEESDVCPEGIIIKKGSSIEKNKLFREGFITVQDESAMLTAPLMDIEKGSKVMDLCSAPGGKTTHMAEIMDNEGEILAFDIHEHKIKLIEQNAKRLGIDIIKASIKDAEEYDETYKEWADAVLADVPCSGLGIIRKKPEIKWNKNERELNELTRIQYTILQNAAGYVKSGGEIIYSTCTLNKKENEDIVNSFIKENPEFKIEPVFIGKSDNILYDKKGYLTILPNKYMDGFFLCKIRKQ